MSVHMPDCDCPKCGMHIDAATSVNGEDVKPKAGDLSICAYCTEFLIFNEDLTFRSLNEQDIAELSTFTLGQLNTAREYLRSRK